MTDLEKRAYILILRRTASSRAELARKLNISRPTASTVTENLISSNLIRECGKGKSVRGTAPTLLSAAADARTLIGIDFGYTDRMSGVLINGAGDIISKEELLFDPESLTDISDRSESLVRTLSCGRKISGVGIALSAIVDEKSRKVCKSINPLFCKPEIHTELEKRLQSPVFFSNRSRAAALSEAFGGAADGENDFALISLGKSAGAAFWCGGELFCGSGSSAGEIRNLRLADGSRLEYALSRDQLKNAPQEEVLSRCADALSQISDMMDFKLLVLSGRFADFGDDFAPLLEEKLSAYQVRVRQARFGRFSAARGAAFRMLESQIEEHQ